MDGVYQLHMFCVFCGEPLAIGGGLVAGGGPVCPECRAAEMDGGNEGCEYQFFYGEHDWQYDYENELSVCLSCGLIDA